MLSPCPMQRLPHAGRTASMFSGGHSPFSGWSSAKAEFDEVVEVKENAAFASCTQFESKFQEQRVPSAHGFALATFVSLYKLPQSHAGIRLITRHGRRETSVPRHRTKSLYSAPMRPRRRGTVIGYCESRRPPSSDDRHEIHRRTEHGASRRDLRDPARDVRILIDRMAVLPEPWFR